MSYEPVWLLELDVCTCSRYITHGALLMRKDMQVLTICMDKECGLLLNVSTLATCVSI